MIHPQKKCQKSSVDMIVPSYQKFHTIHPTRNPSKKSADIAVVGSVSINVAHRIIPVSRLPTNLDMIDIRGRWDWVGLVVENRIHQWTSWMSHQAADRVIPHPLKGQRSRCILESRRRFCQRMKNTMPKKCRKNHNPTWKLQRWWFWMPWWDDRVPYSSWTCCALSGAPAFNASCPKSWVHPGNKACPRWLRDLRWLQKRCWKIHCFSRKMIYTCCCCSISRIVCWRIPFRKPKPQWTIPHM